MAGATDVEVETDGFYNELAATVREVLQTVRGDVECQTLRHVVKTELEALKVDFREILRSELQEAMVDAWCSDTTILRKDLRADLNHRPNPRSASPVRAETPVIRVPTDPPPSSPMARALAGSGVRSRCATPVTVDRRQESRSGTDQSKHSGPSLGRPGAGAGTPTATAASGVVGETPQPSPTPAGAVRDFVPVLTFQARQFHELMLQLNEATDQKLPAVQTIAEEQTPEEVLVSPVETELPAAPLEEVAQPGQVLELPSPSRQRQTTIRDEQEAEDGRSVVCALVRERSWELGGPKVERTFALPAACMGESPPLAIALAWAPSALPSRWRIGIQLTPSRRAVAQLVRSQRFEFVSMLMIVASAVHSGVQADTMAQQMVADLPQGFRIADTLFMFFFIVELCLRLFAYRLRYFTMWGWGWNILDLLLVLLQVGEEIVMLAASNGGSPGDMTGGFLLRVVRVLHTVRVLRLFHLTHIAAELRLLVVCIVHAAKAFYWAAALIMLMIYVFGVHLTQVTALHRMTQGPKEVDRLKRWYGSLPRTMLSLFEGLTSGVSWDELIEPLISEISPWLGVLFFTWMAFVILAVMNVVTATFVQQSIERAAQMKEAQKVTQATSLFQALDVDQSGIITFGEIENHLESAAVREFFRSIDVDVSEARLLFDMLDADNSGEIQFTEFLSGCMRLQGPAKAIDMVLVMRELREAIAVASPVAQATPPVVAPIP